MHEIRLNKLKNRLYFTLGKIEDRKEMKDIIHKTEVAVKSLLQGFSCLSDLRFYDNPDEKDEFIKVVQEILWDSGIGLVVRVKDKNTKSPCFSFEENTVLWPAYRVKEADSLVVAESMLDMYNA
ncbi:MAG: hypothetical protein GY714_08500 [Desulfobacterales bacterium]|nr:hypothetical protein [Desulfobacterales bacterium]MCP4159640.1 hypothetical protein [Deltaproteobacteria bacterium]